LSLFINTYPAYPPSTAEDTGSQAVARKQLVGNSSAALVADSNKPVVVVVGMLRQGTLLSVVGKDSGRLYRLVAVGNCKKDKRKCYLMHRQ
jgi:hypothetical protein